MAYSLQKTPMRFIHRYFWLICLLSFSLTSILSYGFIRNLYFWNEDYSFINSFYTNETISWPYQGHIAILYPFFLLFKDIPAGYFISSLVLYILLALTVSFFIYSFTKSRLLAFVSGLFFSSGYIGSENMFMVITAIPHTFYLILALCTLIFYRNSIIKNSIRYRLFSLSLLIFLIVMISVRAHTLIVLLFLTDIYLLFDTSKEKNYLLLFKTTAKRLSIFIIFTVAAYYFLPSLLGERSSLGILKFDPQRLSAKANLNLFAEIGSYLFPSGLLDLLLTNKSLSLFIASFSGAFLLLVLLVIIFMSKKDKSFRKLLIFLILSWILSYLPYHWKEATFFHPSWSRYFIFGYPFFTMMIALLIIKFFFLSKLPKIKVIGFFLIVLFVSSNFIFGYLSQIRKFRLERSFYLQNFLSTLRKQVPKIDGKTLFYFDVVYDPYTKGLFNSFFACGACTAEYALAFFYHQKPESIKITSDYDDFVSEYKMNKYSNTHIFYYSKDQKLLELSKLVISPAPQKTNFLSVKNEKISFISEVLKTDYGDKNINTGLNIDASNFPSYRPIQLDLDMKLDSFGNDINIYPYPFRTSVVSDLSHNVNSRQLVLNHIVERENFKSNVEIKTSESLYKNPGELVVDSDLETSWIANKKNFINSKRAWIEIIFPNDQDVSEIRWVSVYKDRLPLSYDYQMSDNKEGPWKTVLSMRNRKVEVQKYVMDKFPTVKTRYLRMVIYKTSLDSPAIAEIEVLKEPSDVSSEDADFFLDYPLTGVFNRSDAREIMGVAKHYQKVKIYPLTDKFLTKNQVHPLYLPIKLDQGTNHYMITLPASGTRLNSIVIEFPRIPLSAEISSLSLSLLPL